MAKYPGLVYAVSTTADGNMSLNWGREEEVWENRRKFLGRAGVKTEDCVFTSLVHGNAVVVVKGTDKGKVLEADGFITRQKGVAIFVSTGDCLPVVYFEPERSILGLAHLGWRGVDKGLARTVVERLVGLGAEPKKMLVWIGPGVRKETYWKYAEGVDKFKRAVDLAVWGDFLEEKPGGQLALDLVGFVTRQLKEGGIPAENVEVSPVDTVADRNYFSQFRSDKLDEPQGRFATVVMMVRPPLESGGRAGRSRRSP